MNELLLMFSNSICFVGIMSCLITIIFFTFGKYIEKKIVENNISYLINNLVGDLPKMLNSELKKSINDALNSPTKTDEDEKNRVINSNKSLQIKAFISISIILVICLTISYIIARKINIKFSMVLAQAILLSIGVGLIEILFMYFVSLKYIIVDPSQSKKILLDKIFN
jgi:hypothetical protein